MLYSGLTSVTFRKLTPEEIIRLAAKAGLDCIEWGADIHVPPGDITTAAKVRDMTQQSGLAISSYGSYYRAGGTQGLSTGFIKVLETCLVLGTDTVRIWAGDKGSSECDEKTREMITEDIKKIADMSKEANVCLGLEYHSNTLTDSLGSTLKLLKDIDRENVYTYWQPSLKLDAEKNLNELETLLEKVSNIHVFKWDDTGRQPLSKGRDDWKKYLDMLRSTNRDHFCIMEFVKDDDPDVFLEDAKTLKELLEIANGQAR